MCFFRFEPIVNTNPYCEFHANRLNNYLLFVLVILCALNIMESLRKLEFLRE